MVDFLRWTGMAFALLSSTFAFGGCRGDAPTSPESRPDMAHGRLDLSTDIPIDIDSSSETAALGMESPALCGECHRAHFQDWRGSMHAYATRDPVFVAMLDKGIEETEGKLDQFCIQCHAPVASKYDLTPVVETGGIHTMPLVDDPLVSDGVVCVSCHAISSVEKTLNAEFTLDQETFYGPTGAAAGQAAHPIVASDLLTSSTMCGSCHNVVNPKGALLENTFSEWYASEFNQGDPETDKSCQDCHMPAYEGPIVEGVIKTIHRHTFVGVDLALIDDFPDKERQFELVTDLLRSAAQLELTQTDDHGDSIAIRASVTNINNGHALPSGSTADRQVWVHLQATDERGQVVFESGMLDPNGDLMDRVDGHSLTPEGDPHLLLFGSFLFDENEAHVNFPWQAVRSQDFLLQPGQTGWREYLIDKETIRNQFIRVNARVRYRTFPPFLIRLLQSEGYLAEDAIGVIPIVDMAEAQIDIFVP
jgi:hypothetical protein